MAALRTGKVNGALKVVGSNLPPLATAMRTADAFNVSKKTKIIAKHD